MYIHSYQIHNVLNVYRKQLSHGPGGDSVKTGPSPQGKEKDRITISSEGQRESIMDKVSTEIVARITQSGPQNQFESVLADRISSNSPDQHKPVANDPPDFKYTVIDDKNRKTTNTLDIRQFSPAAQSGILESGVNNDKKADSEKE